MIGSLFLEINFLMDLLAGKTAFSQKVLLSFMYNEQIDLHNVDRRIFCRRVYWWCGELVFGT